MPADEIQIKQVILNLARNSVEAMKESDSTESQLTIRTLLAGDDAIEVVTEDTGPGIAPEFVADIFEPFYSRKSNGMGMGLSISRTIVEAHGGRLWAVPCDGRGAAFHVSLPLHEDRRAEKR